MATMKRVTCRLHRNAKFCLYALIAVTGALVVHLTTSFASRTVQSRIDMALFHRQPGPVLRQGDVKMQNVSLRTRDDVLVPFFRAFNINAFAGVSLRTEVPATDFERALLSVPPLLEDITAIPDESHSRVEIISPKDTYRVGDKLQLRVDLYNKRGRSFNTGGDEVRIWLTSGVASVSDEAKRNFGISAVQQQTAYKTQIQPAVNFTSVAAEVTDLQNGSYIGETTLMWPGMASVHVSLTYPREFLRIVVELRHTLHSMRWITGTFADRHGHQEVTPCLPSAPVPGFARTCNLTSRNAGIPWFCGTPTDRKLTCANWIGTGNLPYTPVTSLSPAEIKLVKKVDSEPFLKLVPNNISFLTKEDDAEDKQRLPRCYTTPRRDSWNIRAPSGWFNRGSWQPSTCTLPELMKQRVERCMRNTTLLLLGDCNMRKWWLAVKKFFTCSDLVEGFWHAPMKCEVDQLNATVLFAPHGMPFNVGTHTDLHTRPLHVALAGLPEGRNTVVVIHYYLHHFNYPLSLYIQRVRAARDTIQKYLTSHPEAKFFIRGPHIVYDGKSNHVNFGDSFGKEYMRIWKEEFQSLQDKVWFLNFWDMSIAAENMSQNPTTHVDLQNLKVLFGYFCREK